MSQVNEKNAADRHLPPEMLARHSDELVYVQLPPSKIDWFNKIIEGYDNLALVSTLNKDADAPAERALLVCWVTADMRPVLLKLLDKLKITVIQAPI